MKLKEHSLLSVSHVKKLITLSGLVLFVLWIIWGNTTLQVSHVEISNSNVPEEFNGFKIAHISDLHDTNWGQTLIQPIQEEKPDIIVITGDLIDSENPDVYNASELINQIKEVAPIYYVTGNHEAWSEHYHSLEEALLKHNVTILDNDSVTIKKNEEEILFMGVQDPAFTSESNLLHEQAAIVETEIHELSKHFNGFKILLSHRSELFDVYVRNDINLVLSGHAHGGQIRLPFIGGLFAPNQGFFPKYTSGVYKEGRTNMVVSRGLGNSIIPVRVNNRPELIFIQLENEF